MHLATWVVVLKKTSFHSKWCHIVAIINQGVQGPRPMFMLFLQIVIDVCFNVQRRFLSGHYERRQTSRQNRSVWAWGLWSSLWFQELSCEFRKTKSALVVQKMEKCTKHVHPNVEDIHCILNLTWELRFLLANQVLFSAYVCVWQKLFCSKTICLSAAY